MNEDDWFIDVTEIADLLGVSRYAVYQMAKQGTGPVQKIGRRICSRPSWIAKYLAGDVGFWSITPVKNGTGYTNPFLRKVNQNVVRG